MTRVIYFHRKLRGIAFFFELLSKIRIARAFLPVQFLNCPRFFAGSIFKLRALFCGFNVQIARAFLRVQFLNCARFWRVQFLNCERFFAGSFFKLRALFSRYFSFKEISSSVFFFGSQFSN